MAKKSKKKKSTLQKLTSKYRLIIRDDETFEEHTSLLLSRMNVYVLLSTLIVLVVAIVISVIVFTPVKEYIPGYSDNTMRKKIAQLKVQTDSLENVLHGYSLYMSGIRGIIEGEVDTTGLQSKKISVNTDSIFLQRVSEPDSLLRAEIERDLSFNPIASSSFKTSIANYYFFTPVKGYITSEYNALEEHFGVDIVAPENETIKATLNGTIIIAAWTLETGYVIAIQHENNLISFYKHNSVLLKKVGNFVKAGDVIAVIGDSGELSTGTHLHFELWHNGLPINPKDYIHFQ